jgi:hypothetical protein
VVHVRRPPVRARTRRAAPTPLPVGPRAPAQRELRQPASDLESVGRKIEPEAAKQIRQTIVPKLRAAIKASAASTLPNVAALPLRPRKRPAPPLSATPARASYASAPQTPTPRSSDNYRLRCRPTNPPELRLVVAACRRLHPRPQRCRSFSGGIPKRSSRLRQSPNPDRPRNARLLFQSRPRLEHRAATNRAAHRRRHRGPVPNQGTSLAATPTNDWQQQRRRQSDSSAGYRDAHPDTSCPSIRGARTLAHNQAATPRCCHTSTR